MLAVVYSLTMHRGVDRGDAAELQYMSALLGICHAPGYAIEVVCGKFFSLLPFGPSIAWRINLMMVGCGMLGCLAMYGTVRRITQQIIPGLVAAGILGFSSIYWSYSLVAEAYIFHGMFLLLAFYTAVRFSESDKAHWFFLTALALGICVAGRVSEVFVLPAFLGLCLQYRKTVKLSLKRMAIAAVLFILPFCFSVAYVVVRDNPELLSARDGALLDELLERQPDPRELSLAEHVGYSIKYNLGLTWTEFAGFEGERIREGIGRYARLLSGIAIFTDAPETKPNIYEAGVGASITLVGLLLAVAAFVFRSRQYGWLLLGLGAFAGNLAFYLWHFRWDGLTFTVPGLAGLALLAGLGAAGPPDAKRLTPRRMVPLLLGVATALALLAGNYRLVSRNTPAQAEHIAKMQRLAEAPFPDNSAILLSYWFTAQTRYALHIEANRTDIRVLDVGRKWGPVAEHLAQEDTPTFVMIAKHMRDDPDALRLLHPLIDTPFEEFKLCFVVLPRPTPTPPARQHRP